jgi:transposase-like protein
MGKRGPKPRFIDVACPNEQCSLFGISGKGNVTGNGTYMTNSRRIRKYICHSCGRVFCDRTNTAFYDLRTSEEKVEMALKMAMRGMSVLGIAEVLSIKPSTVVSWISKAADHCEKVNEVVLKDVETPKVEMDELWTFVGEKKCREMANTRTREHGSG